MRMMLAIAFAAGVMQAQDYGPPGKMVDMGGYRVHLNCEGAGSPTVMIVGGFSFDWSLVQPEIARVTRVCTYDASGTAWSERAVNGESGRACPAWMNEVREVLRRGQERGPYVLVGLSAGAVVARLYAMSYPEEVAGLVLVDHAFLPDTKDDAHAAGPAKDLNGVDSPPVVLSMTPVIASPEDEPGFERLPAEARALDRWARSKNPDLPTEETARGCIAAAEAASNGRSYPLRRMPLVVIRTENDAAGYEELQQHLLSLSSNSRQMVAKGSFHSIEISRPDVVIEGIREAIEQLPSRK